MIWSRSDMSMLLGRVCGSSKVGLEVLDVYGCGEVDLPGLVVEVEMAALGPDDAFWSGQKLVEVLGAGRDSAVPGVDDLRQNRDRGT